MLFLSLFAYFGHAPRKVLFERRYQGGQFLCFLVLKRSYNCLIFDTDILQQRIAIHQHQKAVYSILRMYGNVHDHDPSYQIF